MATTDQLLATVREATAGDFEVYGELGREGPGDIWYLARDVVSQRLVALRAHATGTGVDGKPEYDLEVAEELDATVAVGLGECRNCGASVRRWAKFCTTCGKDLGLGGSLPTDPSERAALLAEVKVAAAGQYEFYGEMLWTGGGIVYFARDLESDRIVRLRLKPADDGYELGETKAMPRLSDRLSAAYVTSGFPTPSGGQAEPFAAGVQTATAPEVVRSPGRTVDLFGRQVDLSLLLAVGFGLIVLQGLIIIVLLTLRGS